MGNGGGAARDPQADAFADAHGLRRPGWEVHCTLCDAHVPRSSWGAHAASAAHAAAARGRGHADPRAVDAAILRQPPPPPPPACALCKEHFGCCSRPLHCELCGVRACPGCVAGTRRILDGGKRAVRACKKCQHPLPILRLLNPNPGSPVGGHPPQPGTCASACPPLELWQHAASFLDYKALNTSLVVSRAFMKSLRLPFPHIDAWSDAFGKATRVGSGSYGDVFRAHCSLPGVRREVAVKVVRKSSIISLRRWRYLIREIDIQSQIRHPNAIQLLGPRVLQTRSQVFIVMELAGQDLFDRITQTGPLPAPQAASLAWQLVSFIHDLHRAGVVHRDIKPENLLLTMDQRTQQLVLKVCDFGFARFVLPAGAHARSDPRGSDPPPSQRAHPQTTPGRLSNAAGMSVVSACPELPVAALNHNAVAGAGPQPPRLQGPIAQAAAMLHLSKEPNGGQPPPGPPPEVGDISPPSSPTVDSSTVPPQPGGGSATPVPTVSTGTTTASPHRDGTDANVSPIGNGVGRHAHLAEQRTEPTRRVTSPPTPERFAPTRRPPRAPSDAVSDAAMSLHAGRMCGLSPNPFAAQDLRTAPRDGLHGMTPCGTYGFAPPEMITALHAQASTAWVQDLQVFGLDVFGAGVVLHVMLTAHDPFPVADASRHLQAVQRGLKLSHQIYRNLDQKALSLIQRMLAYDAHVRPSALAVLNDPWFAQHLPDRQPPPLFAPSPQMGPRDPGQTSPPGVYVRTPVRRQSFASTDAKRAARPRALAKRPRHGGASFSIQEDGGIVAEAHQRSSRLDARVPATPDRLAQYIGLTPSLGVPRPDLSTRSPGQHPAQRFDVLGSAHSLRPPLPGQLSRETSPGLGPSSEPPGFPTPQSMFVTAAPHGPSSGYNKILISSGGLNRPIDYLPSPTGRSGVGSDDGDRDGGPSLPLFMMD